ncbi:MOSC domain-containing protein [Shewanella salipaludis]|uniref:MOSC domain-containing protein n=1 Tax=Shewanella salipaludis TaxID=2723052 RepID=A0A972FTH7_9GAMM|nr:MOSC domain-containing protein [Shewanella salipaludis]NMH65928.1 MOSC domain-containing protein [Shewanella salipaludis]
MQTANVTVLSGRVAPLETGLPSAIDKRPIERNIWLSPEGLNGDQQADKKHHGGSERALHLYPLEHYHYWQQRYPESSGFNPGAFGENLSASGFLESTVCIGDIFQLDEAVIQVSQPRSPCFKLNHSFMRSDMALTVQINGNGGYLFRVLTPGHVHPEARMSLLARQWPELTVREVAWRFFNDPLNKAFLGRLSECEVLSESWQSKVRQRLQSGLVEDWNKRLFGFMDLPA